MFYIGDIELVHLYLPLHDEANARITGTVKKRLHEGFFFIALNITDLKLYFFLGETMKHEKEREGEITDTADTSKCSKETRQGTQHGTDR